MSNRGSHQNKCSIVAFQFGRQMVILIWGYNDGQSKLWTIQNNLNISRNLLTERLKSMASKKLITRYVPDNKKRARYVPTERCKDLVKVFLSPLCEQSMGS